MKPKTEGWWDNKLASVSVKGFVSNALNLFLPRKAFQTYT